MGQTRLSFSSCSLAVTVLLVGLALTDAKVVRYTFWVSYISGSPDGVWVNNILGINGKYPGPVIEAEAGDTLEITVVNNIQDGQNTTLHWHGILQRGTPFEDGPSEITQCPIKAGTSQKYTFEVPLAGTYWYHSHVNSQYTEGLWGLMIIRGKPEIWQGQYDDELVITLSDWYHTTGRENEEYLLSPESGGAPPYPSSALMNGIGRFPCTYAWIKGRICLPSLQTRPVFKVQPGKTYRVRLTNTAGWTAFNFTIDGHLLRAIEVDGVDMKMGSPIQGVYIAPGQRYSFLLSIPKNGVVGKRSLIRANMRTEFLFTLPTNINEHPEALLGEVTGVLQYTSGSAGETKEQFHYGNLYQVSSSNNWGNLQFLNEMSLIPYDGVRAPAKFDKNVELSIGFTVGSDGIRRGAFNGVPANLPQGVPQLAMMIHNATIPESMRPVYVKYGDVVQVVVNNPELGPHPMHLHGHHFWVMGMGGQGDGNYDARKHTLSYTGLRRDTVLVKENSWLVIRFLADNVGVWTLHCHVDWHMLTGMMMTFVEAPELAYTLTIPAEARRVCSNHNIVI